MLQKFVISKKALMNAYFSLTVVLLSSKICDGGLIQEIKLPDGCTPPNCDYHATIDLNPTSDVVSVTVTGIQDALTWIAIAFGPTNLMETQDVILGAVDSSGNGQVLDAWVGNHYTPPIIDTNSSLISSSISYINGVYNMTFSRPRASSDPQDVDFTKQTALYVKCPVKGGPWDNGIKKHSRTPIVSASTICVCPESIMTTVVGPSANPSGQSSGPSGQSAGPTMAPTAGPTMAPTAEPTKAPSGSSKVASSATLAWLAAMVLVWSKVHMSRQNFFNI